MKIIVTGGAGFIGSHIVDKLVEQNHQITIIDSLVTGKEYNINKSAKLYKADITDKDIEQIFAAVKPDFVIHHAAQIDIQHSLKNPVFDANVNILGTINILQCCIKHNVQKIIYASSAAAYGNPIYLGVDEAHQINPMSFYGISKFTPELYIKTFSHLYGLKYTILRYANVYGARQDPKGEGGVVSIFLDKVLNNEAPFIFGDGEQTRDFIYVSDIASANVAALNKGDNEIINISTDSPTTVNKLLQVINSIVEKDIKPVYKDARQGDIVHSYLDNSKAKSLLKWLPQYTLEEGLKETVLYHFALQI